MRRWNGWGDETVDYVITDHVKNLLEEWVGKPKAPKDLSLDELKLRVPDSRLKDSNLINTDVEERIKHSVGQSFSDWVAIRTGENLVFPDGVVFPQNKDDIREILEYAKSIDAIIIPYGGGTSVVGHLKVPITDKPVISVDMRRMNKLIDIDKKGCIANFEAGINGQELEASLRAEGFTLGHYPQSFELSSLGGWIASRSSGHFSMKYGRIERVFVGGNVETPNGRIEIPSFPGSAAGPDIKEIMLGSEGRYGIITDAKVKISPLPETESFNAAFFKNEKDAINAVRQISQASIPLAMMRLSLANETESTLNQLDPSFIINSLHKYLSLNGAKEEKCLLIYGAIGDNKSVAFNLKQALKVIKQNNGIYVGSTIGKHWYKDRFHYPYIRNTLWEIGYASDTLETANIWSKIPETVSNIENSIRHALKDIDEKVYVITHLSHIYPHGSSIYTSYIFRISDNPEETFARWGKIKKTASEAVVKSGGTISHQHGVGIDHKPYLVEEKGQLGIDIIKNIGSTLDSESIMNPGKLV